MSEPHPNDLIEFASYPDTTLRETYPRLMTRGGNRNAEASEAVLAGVVSKLPTPLPVMPPPAPVALPDDPALDEYKAAGWL